jgi:hypothetical protein
MREFNLGDKVKDNVSGFQGIIECYSEYLSGCDRVSVAPDKLSKDGGLLNSASFDVLQLIMVNKKQIKRMSTETGGPRDFPTQKTHS